MYYKWSNNNNKNRKSVINLMNRLVNQQMDKKKNNLKYKSARCKGCNL